MRELNIETESFILGWLNIQRVGCRGQSRTADQEFEPRDNDPPSVWVHSLQCLQEAYMSSQTYNCPYLTASGEKKLPKGDRARRTSPQDSRPDPQGGRGLTTVPELGVYVACLAGKAHSTGDKDHTSLLVLTDGGEFSG